MRKGLEGEYLDLRGRKWCKTGENCTLLSLITCTL